MRDLIFFKKIIVRNPEKVHNNKLSYKLNLAKRSPEHFKSNDKRSQGKSQLIGR
jgi:hypothetical protein